MTETLPIHFQLADVKTEQFAIAEENYNEEAAENVTLHSSFRFGYNGDDQVILASPRFSFDQNGASFIILEIACYFKVESESWVKLMQEDKTITLPKAFAAHLGAISVGIARGVLHAKTEHGSFSRFLIPLLNVAENIKEDVVLK